MNRKNIVLIAKDNITTNVIEFLSPDSPLFKHCLILTILQ